MEITLAGLLIGVLAIAAGLAFAFYGLRIFLLLLPIWGFLAGLVVGASATAEIIGDGFLVDVSGWVVGIVVGLLFAAFSYLYYWVAVILLGGMLGYQLTTGVLGWIGSDADGIIAFVLALIVGAVVAIGFVVLRMPAVLVIVASAISGAGATVAGVTVALGIVPVAALGQGFFGGLNRYYDADAEMFVSVDLSIIWLMAAIALAFAGAIEQARAMTVTAAAITEDRYRNPGMARHPSGTATT